MKASSNRQPGFRANFYQSIAASYRRDANKVLAGFILKEDSSHR